MKKYAFGVDIGGTTCKIGFFDTNGTLLDKWEIKTNTENNGESILSDVAKAVDNKLAQEAISKDDVQGIGIGVPGPVDSQGVVHRCVNLGWGVVNVAEELGNLTGLTIKVGNDANVAALGEMWQGGAKGSKDVIMVTLGTGVGGAIAVKILDQLGIRLITYSKSIGPIACDPRHFDAEEILKNPVYMPDADAAENAMAYLEACIAEQNSSGGVVECIISGVPAGIGDPVFEKLNANLAKAVMSIGAVKGFEIGDGFDVAKATGKNNNDAFRIGADGSVSKETNHAGGILGGMSDGSDIILRATIKPTPSISATQHTVNKSGEEIDINIKGRHDPIIVPRAVVVVESMAAITIVDAMFANMSARMDSLERFYK